MSRSRSNDAYAFPNYATASRGYTVNGLNQYATVAGNSYGYDANGNLTSDGGITYSYDVENRLVGTSAGTNLVYDPLGRLYETNVSGSSVTRFLYDGDELAAEYDASGTMLKRYIHGPGEDDPLAWFDGAALGGSWSNAHLAKPDHQGSLTLWTDWNGVLTQINSYDEYGVPAATNAGRFQYTGQAWIPELGMYYYKARIYSPMLGRFLQTDPIGYKDQNNLYAYVGNDPIDETDPSGTEACTGSLIPCASGGLASASSGSSEYYAQDRTHRDKSSQSSHVGLNGMLQDGPAPQMPIDGDTGGTRQDSREDAMVMAGAMSQQEHAERRDARATGALAGATVVEAGATAIGIRTTIHGAERIAGEGATRGGAATRMGISLARLFGRRMTQADGATVYVRQWLWGGRYDVAIFNVRGELISSWGGLSAKSLARIAAKFGYH